MPMVTASHGAGGRIAFEPPHTPMGRAALVTGTGAVLLGLMVPAVSGGLLADMSGVIVTIALGMASVATGVTALGSEHEKSALVWAITLIALSVVSFWVLVVVGEIVLS